MRGTVEHSVVGSRTPSSTMELVAAPGGSVGGLSFAMSLGMSNTNETLGNGVDPAGHQEKTSLGSTASKLADTAREIPGKVVDAVKPAARFARENALWFGIAIGALAAVGVTLYLIRRD